MKTKRLYNGFSLLGRGAWLWIVATLGCAAGLLIPVRTGALLDRDVKEALAQLDELRMLHPLHLELEQHLQGEWWNSIPRTRKAPLAQDEVVTVPALFSTLAGNCGMELISVRPHVMSAPGIPRRLQVDVQVAGPYSRAREFLLAVATLPSMEGIERVEVRREHIHETYHCSLWLALK